MTSSSRTIVCLVSREGFFGLVAANRGAAAQSIYQRAYSNLARCLDVPLGCTHSAQDSMRQDLLVEKLLVVEL